MAKISLTSFLIRVTDNAGNSMNFDNIIDELGNKFEFYKILNEYFQSRRNLYSDNENNKKILSVNKNSCKEVVANGLLKYRLIKGIIQAGSYGYSSEIYDKDTGKVEFKKPPTSAEMLPFFYGFYLPPNKDNGVCIFQRFSQYGIKSSFEDDIKEFLYEKYPFIRIKLNPLLPEDYLKNFFDQGDVKKIRFIKHEVAYDIVDRINGDGTEETVGEAEYVIKAKRNKGLPIKKKFMGFLEKKTDITRMFEIENFDYNNIKVELRFKGETKTVDMENINNLNGSYDISKDIEYGDNGHPIFEDLEDKSGEYAENFLFNMGLIT